MSNSEKHFFSSIDNSLDITGLLGADPESKELETKNGKVLVVEIRLAVPQAKTEEPAWLNIEAWNGKAKYLATLKKGDRVRIKGSLAMDAWTTKEGEKRNKIYVLAEEVRSIPKFQGSQA